MIEIRTSNRIMLPDTSVQLQAEKYLLPRPTGEYSDADVRTIIRYYVEECAPVQVNPLLAIAQMCVETGNLSSYWAARPRCNPAGIGVTGEPGAGVSFGSWGKSVLAHVGRLVAYCTHPDDRTLEQDNAVAYALRWRDLPAIRQGTATTLDDLAGFWAADPTYAGKLARVANAILQS